MLLANNYGKKNFNISFTKFQCLLLIKINRLKKEKFLNKKFIHIINVILLVATIFWDSNFIFYL